VRFEVSKKISYIYSAPSLTICIRVLFRQLEAVRVRVLALGGQAHGGQLRPVNRLSWTKLSAPTPGLSEPSGPGHTDKARNLQI